MRTSAISWCDYSGGNLNFVTGCTPVSAGCVNCYARSIYERFGKDFSRVEVHPDKLARLAKRRFGVPVKDAAGNVEYVSPKRDGYRPMCFVVDTGDLFHEAVPDAFIDEALRVMEARQDVTWQVLTKRPERMREAIRRWWDGLDNPHQSLDHIWLGVTAENQDAANERIPILLDTPAAVRFVSVEPMLGPVDMCKVVMQDGDHLGPTMNNWGCDARLDWIVCGGESGANRRPFDVAWAADLYLQCRVAHVPMFFKQGSALKPGQDDVLPGVGVVQEWPA